MSRVLWRGKNKADGELELKNSVLPADPKAVLRQDKDGSWIIVGDAVLSSKPVVVKKK